MQEIVERTDGVPLFVEELTKAVLEAGVDDQHGAGTVSRVPLPALAVPASLHASLVARLDRLGSLAKEVVQIGAAIGREFPYELLAPIASKPDAELQAALERLTDAGLVFCRGAGPRATFLFKHALVRDAAYATLLRGRRQELHARIARTLEERFPDAIASRPELLAQHCMEAGLCEKAVVFWRQAARNAVSRAAHREASALLEKALGASSQLTTSQEVLGLVIDIRRDLHTSLYPIGELTRSLAHLEEAERLAEQVGDEGRLSRILSSKVYALGAMGDLARAVEAGERSIRIAQRSSDAYALLRTHMMLARALYGCGDYRQAVEHGRLALDLLDTARGGNSGTSFSAGLDQGVFGRIWLVLCLAELGQFADACTLGQEAFERALRSKAPEELIWSGLGVGRMHLVRGSFHEVVATLEPALELCRTADFPVYISRIATSLAVAYGELGRLDEALTLHKEAIQQALATNFMYGYSLVLAYSARSCVLAGRREQAVEHARQAIDLALRSGQRGDLGWAHWVLGEITSGEIPRTPVAESAETHYRAALTIANELGMRPLRAHCLSGLARLRKSAGDNTAAEMNMSDAATLCKEMNMRLIN